MHITQILNWIVAHHADLLNLIFGAAALSIGLEALLTKLQVKSKKVAFTMLHIFSGLTALASFGLGVSGKEATGIYASIALVAQGWHRFVISSINTNYVTPFLTWLSNQDTTTPAPTPVTAVPPTSSTVVSTSAVTLTPAVTAAATTDGKPFTLDGVTPPPTSAGK